MSKKQIKHLVIQMSSQGGESTTKLINSINTALKSAQDITRSFNREVGGSVKVISNIAREFDRLDKSLSGAAKNIRSVSTALNSFNTDKGIKSLQGYIDGIELATLYIRDLSEEASKAAPALNSLITAQSLAKMDSVANFIEQIYLELVDLNAGSKETINTLDRLAERITDVEVQTKKVRLETERAKGSFEGLSGALARTNTQTKAHSKSTEKLTNDTRRLAGSGSQGARAFSDLAFKMNPLVSLYASVAVNVYALSEAFRVLNNAAGLERLYRQTANFAATLSGINVQKLARDLEAISDGAINAGEALRQATRGVAYGFTAKELEKLTELGRKASIALGIDFADAIDRAFRGIAKQEVEVLDEIGVVTRLDIAFRNYAATLGTSADKLTDVQRRIALTNEVIAQQEKRFAGINIESSGYELLAVSVGNAMDSILMNVAKATDGSVKKLALLLKGFRGVSSASKDAEESAKIYQAALKSGNISQAAVAYSELQDALERAKLEQTEGTEENKKYKESLQQVEAAQRIVNIAVGAAVVLSAKYAATLATTLIVGIASVVTKTIAWATAEATKNKIIVISTAVTRAYAATLAFLRLGLIGATIAAVKFIGVMGLAALPFVVLSAKIAAVSGLVYVLANSINNFAKDIFGVNIFGWLADKVGQLWDVIAKFLKRIGVLAKDMAETGLAKVGDGLEALTKFTGLDSVSEGMLGLTNQTNELAKAAETAEQYIARLSVTGRKLSDVAAGGGLFANTAPALTRAEAEDNLKYIGGASDSMQKIGSALTEMTDKKSPLNDMVTSIGSLSDIPVGLKVDTQAFKDAETRFNKLKDDGVIPVGVEFDGGKGFAQVRSAFDNLKAEVDKVRDSGAFDIEIAVLRSTKVNDPFADLTKAKLELQQINKLLDAYAKVGAKVNEDEKRALEQKKAVIQEELRIADIKAKQRSIDEEIELANIASSALLEIEEAKKSVILAKDIDSLKVQIEKYNAAGLYTTDLEKQLRILNAQKTAEEQIEEARLKRARERNANELAQGILGRKEGQAGSEVARVAIQKQILELKEIEANKIIDTAQREAALNQILLERLEIEGRAAAARSRDFATITGSISSIDGLTELQSTFSSSVSSMTSVWANFQDQMATGSSSFMDYLKGDIEGFANMVQSATAIAQQAFAAMSQAKVDSISREIEAEKRRDGKSEESKAKIKALEAKRIKEEGKAKRSSVIMSTAMAVMQAFAQLGPIAGAPFAAAMAAMGAFQVGQIDKASNGQLAALNDGAGSALSIAGGNRQNSIDVSRSANAGELAYLTGRQGSGSAQNFLPGRAGGNFASAGTSITVGESGPEVITPAVPVNISRAGQGGNGTSVTFAPQYNLSSVDTEGMEELLERHSTALYKGLEKELLARNLSLENL